MNISQFESPVFDVTERYAFFLKQAKIARGESGEENRVSEGRRRIRRVALLLVPLAVAGGVFLGLRRSRSRGMRGGSRRAPRSTEQVEKQKHEEVA